MGDYYSGNQSSHVCSAATSGSTLHRTANALAYDTLLSWTSSTKLLRSYLTNLNLPFPSPNPSAFSTAAKNTPIGCLPHTVFPVSLNCCKKSLCDPPSTASMLFLSTADILS